MDEKIGEAKTKEPTREIGPLAERILKRLEAEAFTQFADEDYFQSDVALRILTEELDLRKDS